ncbi:MAG TPA: hypothetical protein VHG33_11710 [Woeseiaceae bacterium]|nr:hypothetical protein [Woeseiaceae bacterium]
MATIHHEAVAETDRPLISWGAIFAGLVFILAATWLMFLLGSAIGISIADASDAAAMGQGMGIGAIVWLLLTALLAYFLGGLLTGRLSGKPERSAGMLHGITLWSVATVLMLVLGAWGVRGLFQAGSAVVSTTVSAATQAGSAGAQGAQAGVGGALADSPLMTSIQARMKQEIASALAEAQQSDRQPAPAGGQDTPTRQPEGESAGESRSAATRQAASASETPASEREIQQALEEIDTSTLVAATQPIVLGRPEQAKDVLAVNTSLSESEIDAVVDGVMREMSQQINQAQQQMNQAVEQASTYTQAVTWVAFIAGALALLVAIAGGWLGAGRVHRLYARETTRGSAA